jgi:hypothetical protein
VAAVADSGAVCTGYNGTASSSARATGGSRQTDTATESSPYPMATSNASARTQVIYLQSEIGTYCTITGLALNVWSIPGQPLDNWTIRMKHTTLSEHTDPPYWEGDGWTTLYQGDVTMTALGWVSFLFDSEFEYNGHDNLMVDFSFNNTSYSYSGQCGSLPVSTRRTICYGANTDEGDPTTWSGTSTPAPGSAERIPELRLLCDRDFGAIYPTTAGPFEQGVWTGMVTVFETGTNIWLVFDDGEGHPGKSSPFDVCATNTLYVISAHGMTDPIPGGTALPFDTWTWCRVTNSAVHVGESATQYLCSGWTGTGSTPPSGTDTNTGMFLFDEFSTITWQWDTNFYLRVLTNGMGTASMTGDWFAAGASVTVTGFPSIGQIFAGWVGDTGGCEMLGEQIIIPLDQSRLITAEFSVGPPAVLILLQ